MAWAQESSQSLPGFAYLIKLDSDKTRLKSVCIFLLIKGRGQKNKRKINEGEDRVKSRIFYDSSLEDRCAGSAFPPLKI